jgi:hypothetical protein
MAALAATTGAVGTCWLYMASYRRWRGSLVAECVLEEVRSVCEESNHCGNITCMATLNSPPSTMASMFHLSASN